MIPYVLWAEHPKKVRPVPPVNIHYIIHKLYVKAGLIKAKKRRYELRAHSLRKYFRTQLGSLSTMPTDYIEYMMGHKINTYNDVKMKGNRVLQKHVRHKRTKHKTEDQNLQN